ncbi:hypothetical protein [Streptomyces sp. NBC_01431]|uniref:hypothetical protein n=1 Tax=Streptomyces sp. NBC_01431 TaxID=2903863 RepID=UPI003FCD4071
MPDTRAQLSDEQHKRLTKLGITPDEQPTPAPAATGDGKTAGKASTAFQRGIAALAQYIAREGHHRAPAATQNTSRWKARTRR